MIKDLEERRKYSKQYYIKNQKHIREKQRLQRIKVRKLVIDNYGNKCICCGISEYKFLTVDHINGNGRKQRSEQNMMGLKFYYWIVRNNFPKDLQLLCWNCNCSKYYFGGCPHGRTTMVAE